MMAVQGIGNLVQILANQLREQTLNLPAGANTQGTGNADNVAATEDTFTSSAQSNSAQATPQDAGIFQVSEGAVTAVTAGILFAQTHPNATHNRVPAQSGSPMATNGGNVQPATAPNANLPAIPGQLFDPTPAGQAPIVRATPATNVQAQIVALNAGLPALGLSKVEIQEIDSLATQIQNFNPATYTNLVNQFKALAQQTTQQGAPNPAASASTVGSQNTTTSTKGNGNGSQG
jgi:hypothetical protein